MFAHLDDQPDELKAALVQLGELWNLRRPALPSELGRALRLGPSRPDQAVNHWLAGKVRIPAPAGVALEMMLLGALPPDGLNACITKKGLRKPRVPAGLR
jgi:hypothetical protein